MSSASEGGGGTGSLRGVTSEVPGGSTCGSIGGSANPSRRNSRRTGWGAVKVPTKMGRKVVGLIMRAPPSKKIAEGVMTNTSSMGEASVYHALVVIFLEFFAWGLLTRYALSKNFLTISYLFSIPINCSNLKFHCSFEVLHLEKLEKIIGI